MAVTQRSDVFSKILRLDKPAKDLQITAPRKRMLRRVPKQLAISTNPAILRDEASEPSAELLALSYDDAASLRPPVISGMGNSASLESLARADDGLELERPPSICYSPTWSARGRNKSSKQITSAKPASDDSSRPSTSSGRSKRLRKKPPPAAMETQRMSAALSSPVQPSTASRSRASSRDSQWSYRDDRRSSISSFTSFFKFPGMRSREPSIDRSPRARSDSKLSISHSATTISPVSDGVMAAVPKKDDEAKLDDSSFHLILKNFSFSSDKALSKEFERSMQRNGAEEVAEPEPIIVGEDEMLSSPADERRISKKLPPGLCTYRGSEYRLRDPKLLCPGPGFNPSTRNPFDSIVTPTPTNSPPASSCGRSPPSSPGGYVRGHRDRRQRQSISSFNEELAVSLAVQARMAEESFLNAEPGAALKEIHVPPAEDVQSCHGEVVDPDAMMVPQPLKVTKRSESGSEASSFEGGLAKADQICQSESGPAPNRRKTANELIVEGKDGDGLVRRTSVTRPKSTPDLNSLTNNLPPTDFLPPLKHQPLPRSKRSPSKVTFAPDLPPPIKEKSSARYSHSTDNLLKATSQKMQFLQDDEEVITAPSNGSSSTRGLQRRSAIRASKRWTLASKPAQPTPPTSGLQSAAFRGQAMQSKPVAKMFVVCCHCNYWHDLPSRLYEAMTYSKVIEQVESGMDAGENESNKRASEQKPMENGVIVQGRVEGTVKCPWCGHGMATACCEGWTTVVYLHERHH